MKLLGSEVKNFSRAIASAPHPTDVIKVLLHVTALTSDTEAKLKSFLDDHKLTIVEVIGSCWKISGSVADMETAFSVTLFHAVTEGVTHRSRTGSITIPDSLNGVINAVLGLDNPPIAHYQYRVAKSIGFGAGAPATFSPRQVAQAYDFPLTVHNGVGGHITIIELGGKYNPADMVAICKEMNVVEPRVVVIDVDKDVPVSDGPNGADGEVMLDVEVAGGICNHATISMYFAPNTDAGFVDAINHAIHAVPAPDAVSISWGSREDQWTSQAVQAMNSVIQEAGPLGTTVCVASGDGGSDDGQGDGVNLPDFPASSPYSLGCGGTKLATNGPTFTITSEVVWDSGAPNPDQGASGGGISSAFPRPGYQSDLVYPVPGKTGRMVPDVAGNADPNSGYNVIVDGRSFPIGGTSAVAPLVAAAVCLLNASLGKKVGFVNPALYATPQGTFNQITSGTNGDYSANPDGGYCCCTGLGSFNFTKLVRALSVENLPISEIPGMGAEAPETLE